MKILVLFATFEGHTREVARFVGSELQEAGHDVEVTDLSDETVRIAVDKADRVILAGSVHERRHPQSLEVFVAAQRSALRSRPTLMLSVSLNAAFPEGREEAQDYLEEMEMRTDFKPDRTLLVPGAVRTSRYDYFARQVVRHVVLRGRDVDIEASEHDFTDYDALRKTVIDFAAE